MIKILAFASTVLLCPAASISSMQAASDTVGDGLVIQGMESSSGEVPVEAVYQRVPENRPERDVIGVVHAVRRVPGATRSVHVAGIF